MAPKDFNRQLLNRIEAPSPLDLRWDGLHSCVIVPKLLWYNMQSKPRRMKITNTGHTVMLFGDWTHRRPYLLGGPFTEEYVFDNLHFHWGLDDSEGSEHTVDGVMLPFEMHTFWRKGEYPNHKKAIRKRDGVVMVCYLFKVNAETNTRLQPVVEVLENIRNHKEVHHLESPLCLDDLLEPVSEDFLIYYGAIQGAESNHYCYYIISRVTNYISDAQLSEFRKLSGVNGKGIRNFRSPKEDSLKSDIFYVLPAPSAVPSVLVPPRTDPAKIGERSFKAANANHFIDQH